MRDRGVSLRRSPYPRLEAAEVRIRRHAEVAQRQGPEGEAPGHLRNELERVACAGGQSRSTEIPRGASAAAWTRPYERHATRKNEDAQPGSGGRLSPSDQGRDRHRSGSSAHKAERAMDRENTARQEGALRACIRGPSARLRAQVCGAAAAAGGRRWESRSGFAPATASRGGSRR